METNNDTPRFYVVWSMELNIFQSMTTPWSNDEVESIKNYDLSEDGIVTSRNKWIIIDEYNTKELASMKAELLNLQRE